MSETVFLTFPTDISLKFVIGTFEFRSSLIRIISCFSMLGDFLVQKWTFVA